MVEGFAHTDEAAQVLMSFWGRLRSDPRARQTNAELFAGYRKRSADLVRDGQKHGVFRDDCEPEAMGALIVGVVIGLATQALFDPGTLDLEAVVEEATASVLSRLLSAPVPTG